MSREEEIEYARQRDIPVPTGKGPYSTDENLWGRSIEAGDLEDPWTEPPEAAYEWTQPVSETPDEPAYVEIGFRDGLPVLVDGEEMQGVDLVWHLNRAAGEHGVGRIDHVENRLVGIKSREVYESPAAVALHTAHKGLEAITLGKEQLRLKARIAQEYADIVYNGLWFTQHRRDLDAYVESTQTCRWREPSGCDSIRGLAQSLAASRPIPSTTTAWPPTIGLTHSTTSQPRGS